MTLPCRLSSRIHNGYATGESILVQGGWTVKRRQDGMEACLSHRRTACDSSILLSCHTTYFEHHDLFFLSSL